MVTDLCQALGSGSSVCLCAFLLGRQDGDRFVSVAWVRQFCEFACVFYWGDRMVTDLCQSLGSGSSVSLLVCFIGETGW